MAGGLQSAAATLAGEQKRAMRQRYTELKLLSQYGFKRMCDWCTIQVAKSDMCIKLIKMHKPVAKGGQAKAWHQRLDWLPRSLELEPPHQSAVGPWLQNDKRQT